MKGSDPIGGVLCTLMIFFSRGGDMKVYKFVSYLIFLSFYEKELQEITVTQKFHLGRLEKLWKTLIQILQDLT